MSLMTWQYSYIACAGDLLFLLFSCAGIWLLELFVVSSTARLDLLNNNQLMM